MTLINWHAATFYPLSSLNESFGTGPGDEMNIFDVEGVCCPQQLETNTQALMLECRVLIRAFHLPGGKFFLFSPPSNNVLILLWLFDGS